MGNGAFSVTISAIDHASKQIDAINKRIAAVRAPVDRVAASFKKFTEVSGLKKLSDGFRDVARYALDAFESMARVAGPMGAITSVASVAGVFELAKNWADFGVSLQNAAARIGVPVDKLRDLQVAAELAGSSSAALTSGMKGLGNAMQDAIGGRNNLAKAVFSQWHIDIGNLKTGARQVTEILPQVFSHLAKLNKTPALQSEVANVLGIGDDLLPFVRLGAKGYERYLRMAQKMQHYTAANAVSALKLRMSMMELGTATQNLGFQISQDLVPVLVPVINHMTKWIARNRLWLQHNIAGSVETFAHDVQHVVDTLGGWQRVSEGLFAFWAGKKALSIAESVAKVGRLIASVPKVFGGKTPAEVRAPLADAIKTTGGPIAAFTSSLFGGVALPSIAIVAAQAAASYYGNKAVQAQTGGAMLGVDPLTGLPIGVAPSTNLYSGLWSGLGSFFGAFGSPASAATEQTGRVEVEVTINGAPPGTTARATATGAASAAPPRIATSLTAFAP